MGDYSQNPNRIGKMPRKNLVLGMKQKLPLLLDCPRAAEFCDKVEYHEMDWLGRQQLRLHLLFCADCRGYWKRNRKLTQLLQKADLHTCTEQEKKQWQQQLQQVKSQESAP